MNKFLALLLAVITLAALSACTKAPEPVTDRLFEEEDCLLTLTSEYERQETENGILYTSRHNSVHVSRVSAAALADTSLSVDCSLQEWVEAYRRINVPNGTTEDSDGLLSISDMVENEQGSSHRFRSFFFKKGETVYLLTCTADAVAFSSSDPLFHSFAKGFQLK